MSGILERAQETWTMVELGTRQANVSDFQHERSFGEFLEGL